MLPAPEAALPGPSVLTRAGARGRGTRRGPDGFDSPRVEVGRLQVVVNRFRVYPERATDAHRGQFTRVDEPIHRHLGYPHQIRDLGYRQELRTAAE